MKEEEFRKGIESESRKQISVYANQRVIDWNAFENSVMNVLVYVETASFHFASMAKRDGKNLPYSEVWINQNRLARQARSSVIKYVNKVKSTSGDNE